MRIAIYAITVAGARQAAKLKQLMPFADCYIAPVAFSEYPQALELTLPLSDFVSDRFSHYEAHIFICATGIVSRITGPLLKDKRSDPAVVCMDEQAKFVISMLSGHRGGANVLTERVAHIVKATPVITTASDVSKNISVDMLGAPFGWVLDPLSEVSVTRVSAAVVNDEPVVVAQEAGEKNWWKYDKRMPANIVAHTGLEKINSAEYKGAILISDRRYPDLSDWENRVVLWRPKSLVLGLGCDRSTPLSVIKAGLKAFSDTFNLTTESVHSIASIDLKADEEGLLQLSQEEQWPFITFAPEELDGIEGIENPSDYVKKVTGSNSVAEAAALKLSKTTRLTVPKWAFKQDGYNMTVACCRREFSESLVRHKRKNWYGEKKHGSEERHGMGESSVGSGKANEIRVNAHGNEVAEGYICKPKHVDLDRPMLFHRHHILLCEGKRCAKAGSKNLAHDLRVILKEMGLSSGNRRIKISRTMCAGACRNRSTMVVYQRSDGQRHPTADDLNTRNLSIHNESINNGTWMRGVEEFSDNQWRELFAALADNRPLSEVVDLQYFAQVEPPEQPLIPEEQNLG